VEAELEEIVDFGDLCGGGGGVPRNLVINVIGSELFCTPARLL
jgi:hypothetical protein